jgi:membrane protease YdiL (CAAX protease family)
MNGIDVKRPWRRLPIGIGGLTFLLCAAFLVLRSLSMFGPAGLRVLFPLMCIGMIALPWVLLSPHGRYQIGLKLPDRSARMLTGLAAGAAMACLCFYFGSLLFGNTEEHWFASVARSYSAPGLNGASLLQLHLTFTIAACLFSPIGEEIFFRGFLQKVAQQRLSPTGATHLQAALFALVHLCHHGIVATAAGLVVLPLSGALWVLLMFGFSWVCACLRRSSDSLLPAMAAHAAFNAVMNSFIFAYLWQR